MNQAQASNLVQTGFKLLGGMLAAKGMQDASWLEDAEGLAMAIVAWYFSHRAHANTPDKPAEPPSAGKL